MGRSPRLVYTLLLLASGGVSSFIGGSLWPLTVSLTAVAAGLLLVGGAEPKRPAVDDGQALLARLGGERRQRHLSVRRTAEEIGALLSRSGRDRGLWGPERERVEGLVRAHLLLSARLDDEVDRDDDVERLEAEVSDLELRSPTPDDARELKLVRERLELARARRVRIETRAGHLAEIEHGLLLVRDRIASAEPGLEVGDAIGALMGGVEAAATAEIETSRLASGLPRRSASASSGNP